MFSSFYSAQKPGSFCFCGNPQDSHIPSSVIKLGLLVNIPFTVDFQDYKPLFSAWNSKKAMFDSQDRHVIRDHMDMGKNWEPQKLDGKY